MFTKYRGILRTPHIARRRYLATVIAVCVLLILILAAARLTSHKSKESFDPSLAGAYFPLRSGSTWTYRIVDQRQGITDIVTDRAIGKKYVKAFKTFGEAVSEVSRATTFVGPSITTIVYLTEGGYITRLADFDGPGTLLEEHKFLPQLLMPDSTWSNRLFPFISDVFHADQDHRTFFEPNPVVVPAGRFSACIRIETDAVYQRGNRALRLSYIDWYAPNVGLIKTLVLKNGYLDWYIQNVGLVSSWVAKSNIFRSEIARVELLNYAGANPGDPGRLGQRD